jgi:hypothetical protein
MRRIAIFACTAIAALVAASFDGKAQSTKGPTKPVAVVNFPDPQNVAGSVAVTNLPAVQDVNVTNELVTVNAAPAARYQLVGFTTTALAGNAGVLGFTRACQNEFAGSRMCTSLEVMESVILPDGLSGEAWVRPHFVISTSTGVDASGIRGGVGIELTCRGWRSFVSSVNLASGGCDTARAIACCAPAL